MNRNTHKKTMKLTAFLAACALTTSAFGSVSTYAAETETEAEAPEQ